MLNERNREKIDLLTLKRKAPGKFTEDMISALPEALEFDNMSVEVVKLELGDDPFREKLEIDVRVTPRDQKDTSGPKLFFTFTSESSTEDNVKEFREFVEQHHETASRSPQMEHGHVAGQGGD